MKLMKTFRKYYIVVIAILFNSCYWGPTHPYAERYQFNVPEDILIKRINIFKLNNPQYRCFHTDAIGEYEVPDHYSNPFAAKGDSTYRTIARTNNSIYYAFYFYFSDIQATVFCLIWVNEIGEKNDKSTILLDGITYSPNFGGWKTINTKDLSKEDNKIIKKKFEEEILNHLGSWERAK